MLIRKTLLASVLCSVFNLMIVANGAGLYNDSINVMPDIDSPNDLTLSELSSDVNDAVFLPGSYWGLQSGYGLDGWENLRDFQNVGGVRINGGDGVTGRLVFGYDFNRYLGIEGGYTAFGKASQALNSLGANIDSSRTKLLDASLKIVLPFKSKLSLYNKIGAVRSSSTGHDNYAVSHNHTGWLYALGFGYSLTPKWALDLSLNHVAGNAVLQREGSGLGRFMYYQPNADFYALGVTYKFADLEAMSGTENYDDSGVYEGAFVPGLYFGFQPGYVNAGWRDLNDFNVGLHSSGGDGLGGRVMVGYDLNKHFGFEVGCVSALNKAKLTLKEQSGIHQFAAVNTRVFDLLGKIKWPLADGFDMYTKIGVGYVQSSGLHDTGANASVLPTMFTESSLTNLGPVYGIGVGYDVTPYFNIDISAVHYVGNTDLTRNYSNGTGVRFTGYQPNVDLVTLGFIWKL